METVAGFRRGGKALSSGGKSPAFDRSSTISHMNHVANGATYCHGLHYVHPWQSMAVKKRKQTPSRNVTLLGGVHASWKYRTTTRAACGGAYGAWLPIVKGAAYLTDFMVDRTFRVNPACPLGAHVRKVSLRRFIVADYCCCSCYIFTVFLLCSLFVHPENYSIITSKLIYLTVDSLINFSTLQRSSVFIFRIVSR